MIGFQFLPESVGGCAPRPSKLSRSQSQAGDLIELSAVAGIEVRATRGHLSMVREP